MGIGGLSAFNPALFSGYSRFNSIKSAHATAIRGVAKADVQTNVEKVASPEAGLERVVESQSADTRRADPNKGNLVDLFA